MYNAYEIDSGQISVSGTGLLGPLLYLAPTATSYCNIIAVKASVEVASTSPVAVSNSDLFFSLNTTTGSKAGGAAVTPTPLGPGAVAANTVASSGSTAITGLTQSTEKWGGAVPYSAGSFTNEAWENTGREIYLAASSTTAFYVNVPSGPGAGTGFFVRIICWIAE
jgi:hypothetical protein